MRSIPSPDLRPLQQPLRAADLRAARRWLREHRQPADVPGVGLAVAGWVLLAPGLAIVAAALGADAVDPAMPVVGGLMAGAGVALLLWRMLRRRDALRRTARMLRFSEANGLAYAQRALLGPKPAPLLREGFDQLARDALRADDGAEWGVWRDRLVDRRGSERLRGYLELPWSAPAPLEPGALPRGLEAELGHAPLPLRAQASRGRLAIVADRAWRVEDPAVQVLVHRIRSLVAAQQAGPDRGSGAVAAPMPAAIASTDAGRRQRTAALVAGAGTALATIGLAFLQAVLRSAV